MKNKTFLVRGINAVVWERFRNKTPRSITLNTKINELIEGYAKDDSI